MPQVVAEAQGIITRLRCPSSTSLYSGTINLSLARAITYTKEALHRNNGVRSAWFPRRRETEVDPLCGSIFEPPACVDGERMATMSEPEH